MHDVSTIIRAQPTSQARDRNADHEIDGFLRNFAVILSVFTFSQILKTFLARIHYC